MIIGLYFGSFNPIHIGHCIIANHILTTTALDQVWLMVSPQNPFKSSTSLLNEYHRLHLAQIAIAQVPNLKASDFEFSLPRPSYTVDTLSHLHEKYPQHTFIIIMGSDSFKNIRNWKNADVIAENNEVYIYQRPGFPVNDMANFKVKVLDAPLLQISSTHIRESIRNKKSIRFLVHDKVMEEIERNGYYR